MPDSGLQIQAASILNNHPLPNRFRRPIPNRRNTTGSWHVRPASATRCNANSTRESRQRECPPPDRPSFIRLRRQKPSRPSHYRTRGLRSRNGNTVQQVRNIGEISTPKCRYSILSIISLTYCAKSATQNSIPNLEKRNRYLNALTKVNLCSHVRQVLRAVNFLLDYSVEFGRLLGVLLDCSAKRNDFVCYLAVI